MLVQAYIELNMTVVNILKNIKLVPTWFKVETNTELILRLQVRLKQLETEFRLQPFVVLLRNCLDQVQTKDTQNIFAEPVNLKEVSAIELNDIECIVQKDSSSESFF